MIFCRASRLESLKHKPKVLPFKTKWSRVLGKQMLYSLMRSRNSECRKCITAYKAACQRTLRLCEHRSGRVRSVSLYLRLNHLTNSDETWYEYLSLQVFTVWYFLISYNQYNIAEAQVFDMGATLKTLNLVLWNYVWWFVFDKYTNFVRVIIL
jgi:hypothetical protein